MRNRRQRLEPVRVWLARAALEQMLEEAQARSPDETGGMLLGYLSPGGTEIAITDVIGPGPGALHRTHRFEPDGAWQQQQLAAAYQASGRITTFLGDWHSHADGLPAPSRKDARTAARVAHRRASRTRHPLTLILGQLPRDLKPGGEPGTDDGASRWVFAVYRYRRRRLRPAPTTLM
jgi:integrative and conjugative element protein (TIGR02256 family)